MISDHYAVCYCKLFPLLAATFIVLFFVACVSAAELKNKQMMMLMIVLLTDVTCAFM